MHADFDFTDMESSPVAHAAAALTTKEAKQERHHRGIRRQQRYRAKQKLFNLCALAIAQAVSNLNIEKACSELDKCMICHLC